MISTPIAGKQKIVRTTSHVIATVFVWLAAIGVYSLLLLLLFSPATAHANAAPTPTPNVAGVSQTEGITTGGLMQQAIGDASTSPTSGHWALTQLFGTIVDDPLGAIGGSDGATSTVLGSVFYVFNLTLLAVAVLFMTYGLISGVVNTAHEGALLGKKQSTIWTPIRLITGISSLAPMFGGWSMAQLVAIWFAMLGVGAGNIAWNSALDFMSQGGAISLRMPSAQSAELGDELFKMQLCRAALAQELKDQMNEPGLHKGFIPDYEARLTNDGGIGGGNGAAPGIRNYWRDGACGTIQQAHPVRVAQSIAAVDSVIKLPGASTNSAVGSNTASAQYADRIQIASGTIAANIETAFDELSAAMAVQAQHVIDASNPDPAAPVVAGAGYDVAAINTAVLRYENAVQLAMKQGLAGEAIAVAGSDVMTAVRERARVEGFLTAGAYFMSLARAGNSVEGAEDIAPKVLSRPYEADAPTFTSFNARYLAALNIMAALDAKKKTYQDAAGVVADSGTDGGYLAPLFTGIKKALNCPIPAAPLGQCIVAGLIPTGSIEQKNIILVLKEAGDYVMWGSMAAGPIIRYCEIKIRNATGIDRDGKNVPIADAGIAGSIGRIVIKYTPVAGGMIEAGVLSAYSLLDYLSMSFKLLFAFGLMLSVYLPLIPLIHWLGAIITWLAKVVEGVISASLWAFAHLDTDGEGMGQRTQHGYIFMLNLLLTPLLMVIGLIMSVVVMKVVGSLFAGIFPLAIADVQANSMTGLFSIIGFIIIFCSISVMIVTNSCDLIHSIPDNALTWIGGSQAQSMGKKMADNFAASTGALGAIMSQIGVTGKDSNSKTSRQSALDSIRGKGKGNGVGKRE